MKKKHYLAIAGLAGLLAACSSTKKENTVDYDVADSRVVIEESTSVAEYATEAESAPSTARFTPPIISNDESASDIEVADLAEHSTKRNAIKEDKAIATDEYERSERYDGDVRRGRRQQERANLLTATEINDFKKWDEWVEILDQDFASYQSLWGIVPRNRFEIQVVDNNQRPIVDAEVSLYGPNGYEWAARTDNTGKAQLWDRFITDRNSQNSQRNRQQNPYRIVVTHGSETRSISNAQPYPRESYTLKMGTTSRPSYNVDILFMIDTTGSMSDELNYLQAELYNIINKVQQNQTNLSIRMGGLVYRDKGDDYVVRKSSLSPNINTTISFLKKQYADGGGDIPEAVDAALYQGIENENWRRDALARIAFLVLDAPAHSDSRSVARVQEQIKLAAKKGIRIIPLVASGMDQDGEYLMRSMALATNGTYAALTDDSGIGNPHAKPTTNYYRVEKLNALLIRLINEYTRIPRSNDQS